MDISVTNERIGETWLAEKVRDNRVIHYFPPRKACTNDVPRNGRHRKDAIISTQGPVESHLIGRMYPSVSRLSVRINLLPSLTWGFRSESHVRRSVT